MQIKKLLREKRLEDIVDKNLITMIPKRSRQSFRLHCSAPKVHRKIVPKMAEIVSMLKGWVCRRDGPSGSSLKK
ncbi:unnamed protein product [Ilex paraguariensis]|uniref:Uncharacterized protein n=1 Tax=Ilex paraguariensis TaxID=185542 RepID=A0ABC8V4W1_9AQUA